MRPRLSLADRISGCLWGSAVGDAWGGPMECVPAADNLRIFGTARRFEDVTPEMIRAAGEARGKIWWTHAMWGKVTDDTALSDLMLDCILRSDGAVSAEEYAAEWTRLDQPVTGPDGNVVVRLDILHWIERIPFLRNKLKTISKRDLGRGEIQATNALMAIAPVGLLHAGDPLGAELAAVDLTSVNQHGASRDAAGGYAAAIAHCFLPEATVASVISCCLAHCRDERTRYEVRKVLELADRCSTGDAFIASYWREMVGNIFPRQDWQHHGSGSITTWINGEVLGTALALFRINEGGADGRGCDILRYAAMNGRDADTTCRIAGGLLGAWCGLEAIPLDWLKYVEERNAWLRLAEKAKRLTKLVLARLAKRRDCIDAVLADGAEPAGTH